MTVRREIAEPRREPARGAVRTRGILVQYVEGPRGEPAGQRLVVAADRRWSRTEEYADIGLIRPESIPSQHRGVRTWPTVPFS